MGEGNANPKNNEPNGESEGILINTKPMDRYEIEDLYTREDCMFLIKLETININLLGTGFFCNFEDKNILFQNALFTNNNILNKESIELGQK